MTISAQTRWAFGLILVAASLAPVASAHAWLMEAHPGPSQQVPNPPDVLFIRYTENVEREYTRAEVYDVNGTRVDLREVIFDNAKRDQILVPLGNLSDGIYTVRWYSLSVDTHTAQGSYVFAVGSASLAGAPPPSSSHYHGEGSLPIWVESLGRAFHYAAAGAAIGMPVFFFVIARTARPVNFARMTATLAGLAASGVIGASIVLYAFSQRIQSTVGEVASFSISTVGGLLTIRLALQVVLMVLAVTLWGLRANSRAARILLAFVIAAGTAIIITTSLSSHAASLSEGRALAVGADLLHLLAGSVWVGGVIAFLLLCWEESRETMAAWIHRFSPVAITSVLFILLTGTFASLLHLDRVSDLWAGAYGLMIMLKVLLIVPLLAVGAFNRYVARRRLVEGTEWRSTNLHRALIVETLLMASVLIAAGVLATSAPPSAQLGAAELPTTVKFEESLASAHMIFSIGPAPIMVGLHNYTVELHAYDGSNPAGSEVFLQFAPPGRSKLDALHPMERVSADRWTLDGGYLTERGEWTIHLSVQTDGLEKRELKVNVQ